MPIYEYNIQNFEYQLVESRSMKYLLACQCNIRTCHRLPVYCHYTIYIVKSSVNSLIIRQTKIYNEINNRSKHYFTLIVVFAAIVACTSYPAGITAFVPGMNMHGHKKRPVITAKGVLFLPLIRISVLEK